MVQLKEIRSVAVVGGGTMGLGIAQVFRFAGLRVVLCDAGAEASDVAKRRLRQRTEQQVRAGLRPPEQLERIDEVEVVYPSAQAVADSDIVIEAVPEEFRLKQELLRDLSQAARPGTIIATNTSSYPIDALAEEVHHPERFLGLHWFSPPEWVPCVEMIAGPRTSADVRRRSAELLTDVGKRPVEVANAPGFVANRLQMALFTEAMRCVEEGLVTPEQLDEVARTSFGFRLPHYGPFAIADMAGLDTYVAVYECLEEAYGSRFTPPDRLRELVEQGRFGTKTGRGFGEYPAGAGERLLSDRDANYAAMADFLRQRPTVGVRGGGDR